MSSIIELAPVTLNQVVVAENDPLKTALTPLTAVSTPFSGTDDTNRFITHYDHENRIVKEEIYHSKTARTPLYEIHRYKTGEVRATIMFDLSGEPTSGRIFHTDPTTSEIKSRELLKAELDKFRHY